jgi:nucleotide-binding universal stress UspA family protein
VAEAFGKTPGVEITLLNILSGLPPAFWDDGHVLDEKERASRQRMVAAWQKEQEQKWQGLVKKAHECLTKAGVAKDAVVNKFQPKDYDVAEDIISAAAAGNFNTIAMGRRGLGMAKALLLGSVTQKVVQNAKGRAVAIVG